MKIEYTKEWCMRMARLEDDADYPGEIGAGTLAHDAMPERVETASDANVVFGRFVHLMRRKQGVTLEKLAEDADVEIAELVEIEDDSRHRPERRTVYQLAHHFNVPSTKLMQLAGLSVPKNMRLFDAGIRFAARSESVQSLSETERAALDAFVSVLSEQS